LYFLRGIFVSHYSAFLYILMDASEEGHVEIVKIILEKANIDINQQNKIYGRTALMYASRIGHKEIVKMLLEKENIEINQTDKMETLL
jgi:uncharacterized protein